MIPMADEMVQVLILYCKSKGLADKSIHIYESSPKSTPASPPYRGLPLPGVLALNLQGWQNRLFEELKASAFPNRNPEVGFLSSLIQL
ncbi:hypothetical protein DRJ24_02215, partial [Candidatus Acetothermia bacterium]